MSAFIVSQDCMTRCVLAFCPDGGSTPQGRVQATVRGRQLYELNASAVAQRYEEPPDLEMAKRYQFGQNWKGAWQLQPAARPVPAPTPVEIHKSLCCLLYQCSEGNVPETPLYKEIKQRILELANEIVQALPAWDKAPWD